MSPLGDELRRLRLEKGLRQIDVALALGQADASSISNYERGISVPMAEQYSKLAERLGTTVRHLQRIQAPFDRTAPRKGADVSRPASTIPPSTDDRVARDDDELWWLHAWRRLPEPSRAAMRTVVQMSLGEIHAHPPSKGGGRKHVS